MCCWKREFWRFVGWLAFTFALVNSIAMGARVFWWGGGYEDWFKNYLIWLAISGGFYVWHKLK